MLAFLGALVNSYNIKYSPLSSGADFDKIRFYRGFSRNFMLSKNRQKGDFYMERETGFAPATSSLARKHSAAELLPLMILAKMCRRKESDLRPLLFQSSALPLSYSGIDMVDDTGLEPVTSSV
jgi:hypothetical protein